MTDETASGRGDNSPNELEQPPTHLCDRHSSRPTQPSDCRDCDRERELAILRRRVNGLENTLEAYEEQIAHLENRLDNQQEQEAEA